MAQLHRRRSSSLLGRLGISAPRAPLVAAAVIVVALVALGLAVSLFSAGGVTVSRADSGSEARGSDGAGEGGGSSSSPSGGGARDAGGAQALVVHVDGAVARPGVVEVSGSSPRLRDAIEAAGGLAEGADTGSLNLAEKVSDGQKVHVPTVEEAQAAAAAPAAGSAGASGAGGGQGAGAAAGSGSGGGPSSASGLVNINSATASELQTLSGVGESTANAIVRDREQNGPFSSVDDLMRVSGIGEKKLAKIRGSICV
ncbi:helix-hairpin-helix domain-containing protein [Olsenella intestinalis]|uniref:helix-hairpin-helix domain-containing protein n=1 Tax=Olsenella intestinalis TaxID=2930083 RepID=UPI00201039BD|nr:helix-hairpin-helix domain-containing protein [Olsenella intestinalis]